MAFDMSKAAFGKPAVSNLDKVQRIPVGLIRSNEQNFYSIEGIDELADSISMVGLLEPVRVVRIPDGPTSPYKYKLISGHRRFRAFMRLYSRKEEGYLQYADIPALVMEDMDDLTETFALITANSTARELSYAEKLKQEQLLRETLAAMKEAGKEVPKNLGQYIADQIGTSRNEVSRMHSINEHLIPEARAQVDKGEMTAQQAYELSRKPEEEQREVVGAAKSQRDTTQPVVSRSQWEGVEDLLDELLDRARPSVITSRSAGIAELKANLKQRGSFGKPGVEGAWITAVDSILGITFGHGLEYITPSTLYDTISIVAMRRCAEMSKLDTEEAVDVSPAPAAQLWHTGAPDRNDTYVCMYKTPSGNVSFHDLEWNNGSWRKYGQSVGDVYEILKWTEVPEC